ncbi:hypothetical protein KCP75_00110 [Salmonella enterica subsp. enterica]|nr:hypothetical protein KCP75_00110 [Salmonella enterica subsp. enterica]
MERLLTPRKSAALYRRTTARNRVSLVDVSYASSSYDRRTSANLSALKRSATVKADVIDDLSMKSAPLSRPQTLKAHFVTISLKPPADALRKSIYSQNTRI